MSDNYVLYKFVSTGLVLRCPNVIWSSRVARFAMHVNVPWGHVPLQQQHGHVPLPSVGKL
jgi:hypothetical protein